jgi:cytoskeletal protein CcmA (bactofilin family)
MNNFGEFISGNRNLETAVIPQGTVINGNIEISGKLDMYGSINGDISSDSRVNITGNVTGNIKANELDTRDSYIVGNIECKEGTSVHENTVILGNINAQNLVVDGAIQGKLDIKGDIIIGDNAIVDSDIKAKTIQVSSGAAINGHCSLCYADINIAEFFPETPSSNDEPAKERDRNGKKKSR